MGNHSSYHPCKNGRKSTKCVKSCSDILLTFSTQYSVNLLTDNTVIVVDLCCICFKKNKIFVMRC